VVRGALFKRIEEEKGVGWLGSAAQAGHSDSWNNRLRHYGVSSDFRTRTLRRHLDATVAAALQSRNGRQA
jgi:hypothetical protein